MKNKPQQHGRIWAYKTSFLKAPGNPKVYIPGHRRTGVLVRFRSAVYRVANDIWPDYTVSRIEFEYLA